jgi:hypothetical protein
MDKANFLFEFGTYPNWIIVLFIIALLVDLTLKGIALWKAARNSQTIWFVALLIINSMTILPIIYLLTEKGKEKNN